LSLLQELRNSAFANLHSFVSEVNVVLDKAESSGKIQIPTMTLNLMSRSGGQPVASPQAAQQHEHAHSQSFGNVASESAPHAPHTQEKNAALPQSSAQPQVLTPEQMQAQLANTLSILGIDLSLLNTNPVTGSDKP
jgi:LysM repeat protein